MPAGQLNLKIEQGAWFERFIMWQDEYFRPQDLSNYLFRMHIRSSANGALIKEISSITGHTYTNKTFPFTDVETFYSHLEHYGRNPTNAPSYLRQGEIRILLDADSSSLLDFTKAFYDIEAVVCNYISTESGTWDNVEIDVMDENETAPASGIYVNKGGGSLYTPTAGLFSTTVQAGDILMIAGSSNDGVDAESNYGFYQVRVDPDESPVVAGMAEAIYFRTPIRGIDAASGTISIYKVAPIESHVYRLLEGSISIVPQITKTFSTPSVVQIYRNAITRIPSEQIYYLRGENDAADYLQYLKGANLKDGERIRLMLFSAEQPITIVDAGETGGYKINTLDHQNFAMTTLTQWIDLDWVASWGAWHEADREAV